MAKFLTFMPLAIALANFDTQDNLVRIHDVDSNFCNYVTNLDLDNFQPLQKFGLSRHADNKMWFKSTVPVKTIRLNNFPFPYRVRKISRFHYEIECKKLQDYFDGTDNIEVLIRKG